jgi:TP901 family phage tail tape measure protein
MEGDVVARLNDLTKRVDEVAGHASKLDKVFKGFSVVKFDAIANSVSNLRNNINAMVAPGVEFQQEMANLSAITGTVGKDLAYAEAQARKFGISSGLGAKGIVQMQANIASNIDINKTAIEQGVKSVKVLDALTEQAILLAQATGMDALPAANVLTASLNMLNLDVTKTGLLVDLYSVASQKGAAEVDVLFDSLKRTGALANQFKLNAIEVSSALEVISQKGLKGSDAGTAFQAMLAGFFKLPEIKVNEIGLEAAFKEVKKMMGCVPYESMPYPKGDHNRYDATYKPTIQTTLF